MGKKKEDGRKEGRKEGRWTAKHKNTNRHGSKVESTHGKTKHMEGRKERRYGVGGREDGREGGREEEEKRRKKGISRSRYSNRGLEGAE